jgi:hypothetical protein
MLGRPYKCPRAVGPAGGVAPKELASMQFAPYRRAAVPLRFSGEGRCRGAHRGFLWAIRPQKGVLAMELRRPIVLLVLDSDHAEVWSRAEIERALNDTDPLTINDALADLEAEGVVILAGEQVRASRCARQLDGLGVICV